MFAYTNADVAALNQDIRAIRSERGELGTDHMLATKDGPRPFAAGDHIQFTGTARTKASREAGLQQRHNRHHPGDRGRAGDGGDRRQEG